MTINRSRQTRIGLQPALVDGASIERLRRDDPELLRSDRAGSMRGIRVRDARARMLAGATIDVIPLPAVPALQGWYDAELSPKTTDTGVSQLNDLSGKGRHVIQETGGAQPTVSTTDGFTSLLFDGVDDNLSLVLSPTVPFSACTMALVYKSVTHTHLDTYFVGTGSGSQFGIGLRQKSTAGIISFEGTTDGGDALNTTITAGEDLSYAIGYATAGSGGTVYDDQGTTATDVSYTNPRSPISRVTIGADHVLARECNFHLLMVAWWDQELTADERDSLEVYLNGRFQL